MIMYANKVETKENKNYLRWKIKYNIYTYCGGFIYIHSRHSNVLTPSKLNTQQRERDFLNTK